MTLAFSIFICQWFFSYKRDGSRSHLDHPFGRSIWWPLRYHFGSLCFGSAILTVTSVLRAAAQKNNSEKRNLLSACMSCWASCIDECTQHLTKIAWIMMALTGESFCNRSPPSPNIPSSLKI